MSQTVTLMTEADVKRLEKENDEAGFGALRTARGVLPLRAMEVTAALDGLFAETTVKQTFVNALDEPLEASYIFPLPDRAAVTRFRLEVAGRVVEGVLKERAQARQEYEEAIQTGHRAAITEEERPGVFTLRVGNILPGEEAKIMLSLVGPLPYSDGEATYRFPLVVAPRYIPGMPLPGPQVGAGVEADTDATPDASRITPPVLLPGFPNPVQLALSVEVQPSSLPLRAFRSSLHAVVSEDKDGTCRIHINPGERLNRDFILRFQVADQQVATSLRLQPDGDGGTFALTLIPPASAQPAPKPRDVVFILDRSGSMSGWKMVAARRAVGRMVDTLGDRDRFTVYAFDDAIESPPEFSGHGLALATNRNRFRALEFLAKIEARGGTEMAQPLDLAVANLKHDLGRDSILVLVTDGQVGNEDQILKSLGKRVANLRIFTLGIDMAVNEGFLKRLAILGGGCCDLVESEDRLDEVMDKIHRRIAAPVLTGLHLEAGSFKIDQDTLVPARMPDLFAGVSLVVMGRYHGKKPKDMTLQAHDAAGRPWTVTASPTASDHGPLGAVWARGHLRDLEDRYAVNPSEDLSHSIVAVSLKHGVLCRFTAFIAVDRTEIVNAGGQTRQILQPVEMPAGWEMHKDAAYASQVVALHYMAPSPASGCVESSLSEDAEEAESPPAGIRSREVFGRPAPLRSLLGQSGQTQPNEKKTAQPDLTAYRQRAKELLDGLRLYTSADVLLRRQALDLLISKLTALVEDMKSVGVFQKEHRALADLIPALAKPVASEAEFEKVWLATETVLEAFAKGKPLAQQRRASFWK